MKKIKIFLASSGDLLADRDKFDLDIRHKNDEWIDERNIRFQVERWEYGLEAMSLTRKQDDYNELLKSCQIFVMLYSKKVGMYTGEEFDQAWDTFKRNGSPLIYTYFKDEAVKLSDIKRKDIESLFAFQDKLHGLKHFTSRYETSGELNAHFSKQLDMLHKEGKLDNHKSKKDTVQNLNKIRDAFTRNPSLSDILRANEAFLVSVSSDTHIKTELAQMKAAWNTFEREQRIGLLGFDKANETRTRLTYNFLTLLTKIEEQISDSN